MTVLAPPVPVFDDRLYFFQFGRCRALNGARTRIQQCSAVSVELGLLSGQFQFGFKVFHGQSPAKSCSKSVSRISTSRVVEKGGGERREGGGGGNEGGTDERREGGTDEGIEGGDY